MEYFSLPVLEKHIIGIDCAFDRAIENMNRFLDRRPALPTAFFCANDIIAYGCMQALRAHNISVPGDVSVIGFDDLPSSSLSDPPLTTVRVSTRQIGVQALRLLSRRIAGFRLSGIKESPLAGEEAPENILVSGSLVERNSVRQL
jgi:LacI family transcriptional regulator